MICAVRRCPEPVATIYMGFALCVDHLAQAEDAVRRDERTSPANIIFELEHVGFATLQ